MDNGGSASTYLKQSKVPVYTHEECTKKIWVSKKDNICLGGSGSSACFGDSGGPLVCEESGKWVLRGASSYVTGKNCPVHKYSVYARVSSYIDWIYDNMGVFRFSCFLPLFLELVTHDSQPIECKSIRLVECS